MLTDEELQQTLKAHRLEQFLTPFDLAVIHPHLLDICLSVENGDPLMSSVRRYCAVLGLQHDYSVDSVEPTPPTEQ